MEMQVFINTLRKHVGSVAPRGRPHVRRRRRLRRRNAVHPAILQGAGDADRRRLLRPRTIALGEAAWCCFASIHAGSEGERACSFLRPLLLRKRKITWVGLMILMSFGLLTNLQIRRFTLVLVTPASSKVLVRMVKLLARSNM